MTLPSLTQTELVSTWDLESFNVRRFQVISLFILIFSPRLVIHLFYPNPHLVLFRVSSNHVLNFYILSYPRFCTYKYLYLQLYSTHLWVSVWIFSFYKTISTFCILHFTDIHKRLDICSSQPSLVILIFYRKTR